MIEKVSVDLTGHGLTLLGAVFRYDVMSRLARAASERDVRLLAFGFGPDRLRLVLEGEPEAIARTVRGVKVGTIRAAIRWGLSIRSGQGSRQLTDDLFEAVVWAHRAPLEAGARDPLASPWSSHRDLLGFRQAGFYDRGLVAERLDPRAVHEALGGTPLRRRPPNARADDLGFLLRVAGAVLGVLPADRRCFRLFVHLAKARGHRTFEVADALSLTERRVRQMAAEPEPALQTALEVLESPALSRVP